MWFSLIKYLPDLNRLRAELGVKGWWKSKVTWFNTITLASGLAVTLFGDRWGLTQAQAMGMAVALSSAINHALRLITLRPVWKYGSPLTSKTLWVNGVALLSALLVVIYGPGAALPQADIAAMGVGLHTLINFLLRFTTRKPISLRGEQP